MDKGLLLKHIKGETSPEEAEEVIRWIDKSPENEQFYISLLNTYAIESVSDLTDSDSIKFGKEDEALLFKKALNKKRIFVALSVAAAAVLVLSLGLNLYFLKHRQADEVPQLYAYKQIVSPDNIRKTEKLTYFTNPGVKGKVVLPDGSIVWLNSCSKISYPDRFSGDTREVQFEGEGYFSVIKNPNMPMIIKTSKGTSVKVRGTRFTLKSYSDDSYEQTTLLEGKIELSNGSAISDNNESAEIEMVPRESVILRKNRRAIRSFNADTLLSTAWKNGHLLFNKTPVKEVCKALERWHGIKIIVKDKTLDNYTFTADFSSESIVQIMELVKFTMPVNYSFSKDTITIYRRI